ncbi:MAG: hypothetical protein D6732_09030 [Methanobacteriota archaeon]|nr:MAG: hypothetical protein D6732_09030 [Euryarchaeota archaeon]
MNRGKRMTEITIKIPNDFQKIIDELDEPLYIEALKEVVRKKFLEKRKKLNAIQKKINAFQAKYSASFEEFAQNLPNTRKAHDDWIEWSYLESVAQELAKNVSRLEQLPG